MCRKTASILYRKQFLCQDWLKDVLRRGVAFATDAVQRRHYTGCMGNGMSSKGLVDGGGDSLTDFLTAENSNCEIRLADGR